MKTLQPVLVVNLNSLHGQKGDIRRLRTYIELGHLKVTECNYCKGYEVFYEHLPYGTVKKGHDKVSIIKFQYDSSPRGVHSFLIYPLHIRRNSYYPNNYIGWGSYPDQAFVKLSNWVWADELLNINFFALRDFDTENLNTIGQISAGNAGGWMIVSDTPLGNQYATIGIEDFDAEQGFIHPSCAKKAQEEIDVESILENNQVAG